MTIIPRNPVMLLLISPSLGAGPYDQLETPEGGSPSDSLDFSQSTRSGAEVTIQPVLRENVVADVTDHLRPATFCNLKWKLENPAGPGYPLKLDVAVHLDRDQEAFTYFIAHSESGLNHRNWIINESRKKLSIKAIAYKRQSRGWVYPELVVKGEERSQAEEALSQGGPFSPVAHLKGMTVEPLITSIDWKADSEQLKCDKIFHFIANHPPGGYPKGDLRWLFDFVEANTERIQDIIEGWKPIKKSVLRRRSERSQRE